MNSINKNNKLAEVIQELDISAWVHLGDVFGIGDEDDFDKLKAQLDDLNIEYETDEDSFYGLYLIRLK